MASIFLKLQWRQSMNVATKSVWAIVGLVFAILGAIGLAFGSFAGVIALRFALPELLPTVLVLIGALIPVFWSVGQVLLSGQDLLAAEKFSLLPVAGRQLAIGTVVAQGLGIGGITMIMWLLAATVGWSISIPAMLVFLILLPVTLVTTVLITRVVSMALARAFASRIMRDTVSIVMMMVLMTVGIWLQLAVGAAIAVGDAYEQFVLAIDVISFTPLAATYGVAMAVAQGSWLVAGIRLVIAVVSALALFWLMERMLSARLTDPVRMRGGGTVRSGGFLDRVFPATPAGAIAVRSLKYRRRDARHVMNAIMTPFLPVFIMVVYSINGVVPLEVLPYLSLFLPFMVLTVLGMDLAYDHGNLAMHILAGVSGRDDRAGRALAIGSWAIPFAFLLVLVPAIITGHWEQTVPAMALVVPATLVSMGVASLLSVYLPGRAPKPGASPFGKGSSGGIQAFALLLLGLVIVTVVMLPIAGLLIGSIWVSWLQWPALIVGVAIGVTVLILGIRKGGKALDKRFPTVLAEVTSES